MKKQIYDFESETTKKVEVGAFDTHNIGPDLELLKKQREAHRKPATPPLQPKPVQPKPVQQAQTQQQPTQQIHPAFKPVREPQEAIIIDDSVDDEFDSIMAKTKASAVETIKPEQEKRKVNWFAIGFGILSLLLAVSLIFVSMSYFAQVSENTKMQSAVKEADDIKRNNNAQINTLKKQKEDVDAKLKEAQKERDDLQTKLTAVENDAAAKNKDLETTKEDLKKTQEDAQKKIDELQKKNDDLQKQIDNIKKAAGA